MPVHETDICIIGGGITSAMLAQRLAELRPGVRIIVVEAGRSIFDAQNRGSTASARLITASIRGTTTTSRINRPRASSR